MRRKKNLFILLLTFSLAVGAYFIPGDRLISKPIVLAPDPNGSHIAFFALGDQGDGSWRQKNVSRAMEEIAQSRKDINFTILLGDNFYPDGVSSKEDAQWITKFESVYDGRHLQGIPFYAILGNHDYRGNPQSEIEYSRLGLGSRRWKMCDHNYFRDFGRIDGKPLLRIVFIDTVDMSQWQEQEQLIKSAFADVEKPPKWKIIAGHHPVFSFGKHGDNEALIKWLHPLMKSVGVDVYLSGHDHILELIDKNEKPLYLVSGGGGKSLYNIKNSDNSLRFAESKYGFSLLTVEPSQLVVEFFNEEGKQEYHMEIPGSV